MRFFKFSVVFVLAVILILPAFARPPKGIKPADAYMKATKIAVLANPPRHNEALAFIDTILTYHGAYPEAYFYQGNIYAEFVNRAYDLNERLKYARTMAASYDSMLISCDNKDLKKKHRK
ncbi:MAG: hypothetical protein JSV44_08035, partial [Candidatus Zixiibacteriota bacterium]